MVKKGQLDVSKMDSPEQGEERDPDGPTPAGMKGHTPGHAGTAAEKRSAGSQSQSRSRPGSAGGS